MRSVMPNCIMTVRKLLIAQRACCLECPAWKGIRNDGKMQRTALRHDGGDLLHGM